MSLRTILFSKKSIGILLVGVLACFAIWNFLITPATAARDEANQNLQIRERQAGSLRAELTSLQEGNSNATEIAYSQARLLEQILQPGAVQDQRIFLLGYMTQLPSRIGVDGSDSPLGTPQSGPAGTEFIDYSYNLNGSLPQTVAFLDAVHNLPMLATVTHFSTQYVGTAGRNQWSSSVTVRVWWSSLEPLPGYTPPDLSQFTPNAPQAPTPPTPTPTPTPPGDTQTPPPGPADQETTTTLPSEDDSGSEG